ncbi:hypothetical protein [Pedobacter gandavensis]|uniref:hypothetical protein n=1 Tax=Pedobacter gandavensis TaxID=2679963 RepID=UPI002931F46A|nr:hypothetical protein [Pedobacter gandavensis]
MKKSNFSEPQIIKILSSQNQVNPFGISALNMASVREYFTNGRVSIPGWKFLRLNS